MADEAKQDAGATFYDVRSLNRWFFVSVAVLTVAYFWSVAADHDREFKWYQREFQEEERLLAARQARELFQAPGVKEAIGGQEGPGALAREIERLRAMLDADSVRRPKLVAALQQAQFVYDTTNADMKYAKALFETERFVYEELFHHYEHAGAADEPNGGGKGAAAAPAADHGAPDLFAPRTDVVKQALGKYLALKADYERLEQADKAAEAARDAAKAELDALDALADDVAAELEAAEREIARLEKRGDSLDSERWFWKFRNSIFFDFMAPTITPRKIVVKEILDDLNFLSVPKIDMCVSCHLATDRFKDYPPGNAHVMFGSEGNEPFHGADSPAFRSHSQPELFCSSLSPHDQLRFGCSGCHGGGNQRLRFAYTHHTPSDLDEREAWEKDPNLEWHPVHEWEYPMLGSRFLEASCYKCHQQETHIPGAPKWNRGRDLVAKLGCFGCHKMAPFEGTRRTGPPLAHVTSKFADLDFMLKWVDDPQSFRPTTRMPAFFHRENRATEPGRDQAEITALATYLYTLASPQELRAYPGTGDATRGRALMGEMGGVGCLGCHSVDDFPAEELDPLCHGPELSGIGSKVTPDWLYTWLLDPKSLWPDTDMPDLRLTEPQAADLVAYLMTKRNAAFEQKRFERPADDAIYEAILAEKLSEQMTLERAQQQIAAMSGLEKRRKSGEFLLNHYGCFGCHDIPGYEDAKPIGTELNGWGSKHADRLDFGMVEMDWKRAGRFNREAWLQTKLENTRFYDRGKDKKPFEKLKMPQFSQLAAPGAGPDGGHLPDLAAEDRDAVMTFVLSLVKDNTLASIKRTLSPDEQAVERGARLVRQKNCIGCHKLYGEGGEIRAFQRGDDASAYWPPLLDGQGARTQPEWLAHFLADPVFGKGDGAPAHLRPWMKARMPTFGFTQQELNDVVAYFAHEKVWHTSVDRALWDELAGEFRANFKGYEEAALRRADTTRVKLFHDLVARNYERQGGAFISELDYPFLPAPNRLQGADLDAARGLFERLKCVLCHMPGGVVPAGKTAADMAPDLTYARERLSPRWVKHWLEGPDTYQPGTKMTAFWLPEAGVRPSADPAGINDPEREMTLLRDYLFAPEFANDYQEVAKRAQGQ